MISRCKKTIFDLRRLAATKPVFDLVTCAYHLYSCAHLYVSSSTRHCKFLVSGISFIRPFSQQTLLS